MAGEKLRKELNTCKKMLSFLQLSFKDENESKDLRKYLQEIFAVEVTLL